MGDFNAVVDEAKEGEIVCNFGLRKSNKGVDRLV